MNATLLALLSVLSFSAAASSLQTIKAKEGGKAILSCFLDRANVSGLTVECRKDGKDIVHLYRHGGDYASYQSEEFKNRTLLFHDALNTGNVTLQISGLRPSDAGTYRLRIPRQNFFCHFKVDVEVPLYNNVENSTGRPPLEDMTKEPSSDDPECKNRNVVRIIIISTVFAVFFLLTGVLIRRSRGTTRIKQEYELADVLPVPELEGPRCLLTSP